VADAKYAERNIGLSDLRAFAGVVRDLKANKGIFVTSTGFSESALQFANEEGIALAVIKREDQELKPDVISDAIACTRRG
jgi:restriction endonuclease Mrr